MGARRTFAAAELGAPDGGLCAEELEQRRRRVDAGRLVPLAVHRHDHRPRRRRRLPHISLYLSISSKILSVKTSDRPPRPLLPRALRSRGVRRREEKRIE